MCFPWIRYWLILNVRNPLSSYCRPFSQPSRFYLRPYVRCLCQTELVLTMGCLVWCFWILSAKFGCFLQLWRFYAQSRDDFSEYSVQLDIFYRQKFDRTHVSWPIQLSGTSMIIKKRLHWQHDCCIYCILMFVSMLLRVTAKPFEIWVAQWRCATVFSFRAQCCVISLLKFSFFRYGAQASSLKNNPRFLLSLVHFGDRLT